MRSHVWWFPHRNFQLRPVIFPSRCPLRSKTNDFTSICDEPYAITFDNRRRTDTQFRPVMSPPLFHPRTAELPEEFTSGFVETLQQAMSTVDGKRGSRPSALFAPIRTLPSATTGDEYDQLPSSADHRMFCRVFTSNCVGNPVADDTGLWDADPPVRPGTGLCRRAGEVRLIISRLNRGFSRRRNDGQCQNAGQKTPHNCDTAGSLASMSRFGWKQSPDTGQQRSSSGSHRQRSLDDTHFFQRQQGSTVINGLPRARTAISSQQCSRSQRIWYESHQTADDRSKWFQQSLKQIDEVIMAANMSKFMRKDCFQLGCRETTDKHSPATGSLVSDTRDDGNLHDCRLPNFDRTRNAQTLCRRSQQC